MTDQIRLTGIEVFAHHGVLEEEKRAGQLFLIDAVLELDLAPAGASDALEDTVDYAALAAAIESMVATERWDLIERVAERVAGLVLDHPAVASVEVTVHKPEAPVGVAFADVSVTIRRSRR